MNTRPNPLMMPKRQMAAEVFEYEPGKTYRPGHVTITESRIHDGVIKAKNAQPGMTVRAYLHGEPKGGERVIKSVTRSEDGSEVLVEFSTPHPPTTYKAAYRFYVTELDGAVVSFERSVPALVEA